MHGVTEPASRPYAVDDLRAMPDDGRRRELIDGMLLVTPAPGWAHQEMALSLYTTLRAACPPHLRALAAPFAVRTGLSDEVQPDVLVARFADLTASHLPVAPVLAVEVESPSTSLSDRNLKRAHYQRLGVVSYWMLRPAEPGTLEILELDGAGCYRPVVSARGDEEVTASSPFPVSVRPARFLDGLRPRG